MIWTSSSLPSEQLRHGHINCRRDRVAAGQHYAGLNRKNTGDNSGASCLLPSASGAIAVMLD